MSNNESKCNELIYKLTFIVDDRSLTSVTLHYVQLNFFIMISTCWAFSYCAKIACRATLMYFKINLTVRMLPDRSWDLFKHIIRFWSIWVILRSRNYLLCLSMSAAYSCEHPCNRNTRCKYNLTWWRRFGQICQTWEPKKILIFLNNLWCWSCCFITISTTVTRLGCNFRI